AAPAAADVEEPLARTEAELPADEVELCELRVRERLRLVGEVGARVDHPLVEEEREELVRERVVVVDRLPVAGEAELPAAHVRGGTAGARPALARKAEQQARRAQSFRRRPPPIEQQVVCEKEDRLDLPLDVDVTIEVRLGHRELVRGPEERPQRAAMLEHE